jgi:hypothetical protein
VNISTTVPIKLTVPLELDMSAEPVASYLDRLYAALIELGEKL